MTVKNDISRFPDRFSAGCSLAGMLSKYNGKNTVVLSLTLNGLPVAAGISRELDSQLDIIVCEPSGGEQEKLIFRDAEPSDDRMQRLMKDYQSITGRDQVISVRNKTVVLTDEGLDRTEKLIPVIRQLKKEGPRAIVIAIPVGAVFPLKQLEQETDDVVCLLTPVNFITAMNYYDQHHDVPADMIKAYFSGQHCAA